MRLEAMAMRLEAIASWLEAIAIRLEAIASRLEAIAIRLEAIASRLQAITFIGFLEVSGFHRFLQDFPVSPQTRSPSARSYLNKALRLWRITPHLNKAPCRSNPHFVRPDSPTRGVS